MGLLVLGREGPWGLDIAGLAYSIGRVGHQAGYRADGRSFTHTDIMSCPPLAWALNLANPQMAKDAQSWCTTQKMCTENKSKAETRNRPSNLHIRLWRGGRQICAMHICMYLAICTTTVLYVTCIFIGKWIEGRHRTSHIHKLLGKHLMLTVSVPPGGSRG